MANILMYKLLQIRVPIEYFNYEEQISIVLPDIADANAKFISFDLGSPGSQLDSGIFKSCNLGMTCKSTFFQQPCKLAQRVTPIP